MILAQQVYCARKSNSSQTSSHSQENNPKGLTAIAIFVTVLLWASAFPAISVALTSYTAAEVALLRYIVASFALIIYAIVTQIPIPRLRDLPLIAACGFIGFTLYNFMLNAGQVTVSAGMASFIISSEVGVIALLARLFFGEHLGRWGWIGVVLCIIGVGIISFGTDGKFQISTGVIQVFIATLSISIYSVMQKPLLRRYSPIQFITYAIWAGTFFLFFLAPQAAFSVQNASTASTLCVVYMGLFPGVIAYITWSYVLSRIPASQAGSYLALIPVAALLISWIWLKEIPALNSLLGGTVVFLGVTLVNKRRLET